MGTTTITRTTVRTTITRTTAPTQWDKPVVIKQAEPQWEQMAFDFGND